MLQAMNGDFLMSSKNKPDLSGLSFKFDGEGFSIGASTVLMCATAKTYVTWWQCCDIEKFKITLRANFLTIMNEYKEKFTKDNIIECIKNDSSTTDSVYVAIAAIPIGLMGTSLDEINLLTNIVVDVLHGSSDARDAALAITSAVFLIRKTLSKEEVAKYINKKYYNLNFNLNHNIKIETFTAKEYVPLAIKCILETKNGKDAFEIALLYFEQNSEMAALIGGLIDGLDSSMEECDFQTLFKKAPSDLMSIYQCFHSIRFKRKQFDPTPCLKLEKYQDVFIERYEYELDYPKNDLLIAHNFVLGGGSMELYLFSVCGNFSGNCLKAEKEFISIDEDDFILLEPFFNERIFEFEHYGFCNPCKGILICEIHEFWRQAKEDLINETKTELLERMTANASILSLYDKAYNDELFIEAFKNGDNKKREQLEWNNLFKNKDVIIKFMDAFFWYFEEHLMEQFKINIRDEGCMINIIGP